MNGFISTLRAYATAIPVPIKQQCNGPSIRPHDLCILFAGLSDAARLDRILSLSGTAESPDGPLGVRFLMAVDSKLTALTFNARSEVA